MPNRIVRETILTSGTVDALSESDELFYRRLINVVDDFGRFDGRPRMILAACYPLRAHLIGIENICAHIQACEKNGLIIVYEVSGKQYLQLFKLGEPRAKTSKFPEPPTDARACAQMRPYSPYALRLTPTPTPTPIASDLSAAPLAPLEGVIKPCESPKPSAKKNMETVPPGFARFWEAWPPGHFRKKGQAKCIARWKRMNLEAITDSVLGALEKSKRSPDWTKDGGQFIPGPLPWINDTPWMGIDNSIARPASYLKTQIYGEK
jgi:hypothetical protein